MDFKEAGEMLDLVNERLGQEYSDAEALLEATKGKKDAVEYYRPYFVCAALLDTQSHFDKLIKGEGAEFADPSTTVIGYLDLQRALDGALGLTVPEGAEATYKCNPCRKKGAGFSSYSRARANSGSNRIVIVN